MRYIAPSAEFGKKSAEKSGKKSAMACCIVLHCSMGATPCAVGIVLDIGVGFVLGFVLAKSTAHTLNAS